ncbi:hypothetical protein CRUP_018768 [Coryphaenoides rupestris]|nr:hypothetical protein CRUP_018768 [Coryphaenoides rupestris]
MAAYAVLTLGALGEHMDAVPIIMWLSQQRNHLGGYGSTQDTVVALQALTSYSLASAPNLSITVTSGTSTINFSVDHNNYVVVQSQQIDTAGDVVLQVEAQGTGMALVELHVFYNIDSSQLGRRRRRADDQEAFLLDIQLFDQGTQSAHLSICTRLAEDQDLNETGMAILEVGLLSGLVLAQGGVPTDRNVKKVETEDGKVILYLASVSRAELCVQIPLMVEFTVARVQHAFVIAYDYYEPISMCGGQTAASSAAPAPAHTHRLVLLVFPLLVTLGCAV